MVNITAWKDAKTVRITGDGFKLSAVFQLTEGIALTPDIDELSNAGLDACSTNKERASIETMHEIATFTIEVRDERGGVILANAG